MVEESPGIINTEGVVNYDHPVVVALQGYIDVNEGEVPSLDTMLGGLVSVAMGSDEEQSQRIEDGINRIIDTNISFFHGITHAIPTSVLSIFEFDESKRNTLLKGQNGANWLNDLTRLPVILEMIGDLVTNNGLECSKMYELFQADLGKYLDLRMDYSLKEPYVIPSELMVNIHAILTNVQKVQLASGKPKKIPVTLAIQQTEDGLTIDIADAGPGFKVEQFVKSFSNAADIGEDTQTNGYGHATGTLILPEGKTPGKAGQGNGTVDLSRYIAKKGGELVVSSVGHDDPTQKLVFRQETQGGKTRRSIITQRVQGETPGVSYRLIIP